MRVSEERQNHCSSCSTGIDTGRGISGIASISRDSNPGRGIIASIPCGIDTGRDISDIVNIPRDIDIGCTLGAVRQADHKEKTSMRMDRSCR